MSVSYKGKNEGMLIFKPMPYKKLNSSMKERVESLQNIFPGISVQELKTLLTLQTIEVDKLRKKQHEKQRDYKKLLKTEIGNKETELRALIQELEALSLKLNRIKQFKMHKYSQPTTDYSDQLLHKYEQEIRKKLTKSKDNKARLSEKQRVLKQLQTELHAMIKKLQETSHKVYQACPPHTMDLANPVTSSFLPCKSKQNLQDSNMISKSVSVEPDLTIKNELSKDAISSYPNACLRSYNDSSNANTLNRPFENLSFSSSSPSPTSLSPSLLSSASSIPYPSSTRTSNASKHSDSINTPAFANVSSRYNEIYNNPPISTSEQEQEYTQNTAYLPKGNSTIEEESFSRLKVPEKTSISTKISLFDSSKAGCTDNIYAGFYDHKDSLICAQSSVSVGYPSCKSMVNRGNTKTFLTLASNKCETSTSLSPNFTAFSVNNNNSFPSVINFNAFSKPSHLQNSCASPEDVQRRHDYDYSVPASIHDTVSCGAIMDEKFTSLVNRVDKAINRGSTTKVYTREDEDESIATQDVSEKCLSVASSSCFKPPSGIVASVKNKFENNARLPFIEAEKFTYNPNSLRSIRRRHSYAESQQSGNIAPPPFLMFDKVDNLSSVVPSYDINEQANHYNNHIPKLSSANLTSKVLSPDSSCLTFNVPTDIKNNKSGDFPSFHNNNKNIVLGFSETTESSFRNEIAPEVAKKGVFVKRDEEKIELNKELEDAADRDNDEDDEDAAYLEHTTQSFKKKESSDKILQFADDDKPSPRSSPKMVFDAISFKRPSLNSSNTQLSGAREIAPNAKKNECLRSVQNPTKKSASSLPFKSCLKNTKGKSGRQRSSPSSVVFDPFSILLDASLEGELDLVIQSVQKVKNPSMSRDDGITALHNAICAGHMHIVKYLVEYGCDINAQDSDGWTPLHCAASCNNLRMIQYLVEHGANIFATTISDQDTPVQKCDNDEDNYTADTDSEDEFCQRYLLKVQDDIGSINDGKVYALYDYIASQSDELSFKTHDLMYVLNKFTDNEIDWWLTKLNNKTGFVPINYIALYPRVKANETSKSR